MHNLTKKKIKTAPFLGPYLVIDYGNSLVKAAIFVNNEQIELITSPKLNSSELQAMTQKHNVQHAIVSSVVKIPDEIKNFLNANFYFIDLSHLTPIPIQNLYKTPETLGRDRLSVAVAAHHLYPKQNVLVIDAGTCITFDFIDSEGRYHGGGIAPGVDMRFKALHTFTERLPLLKHKNFEGLSGADTAESICSGVLNGITAEYDGIIHRYSEAYQGLQVIVTGGDVNFFAGKLKSNIFAVPNLVLQGLNIILNFNAKRKQEDN